MTTRQDGRQPRVSEIVSKFMDDGGPKALADMYRAAADAGYGDGTETRHKVRRVIHSMHKAGRIRRVSAGIWEATT